jgi:TetR/AcrR family tetracycline transcriptional repressor
MSTKKRHSAPSRTPLSQLLILDVALAIVDQQGLKGLTIRRMANSLGVTPMAIYRHYANKAVILEGLVEHALRTSPGVLLGEVEERSEPLCIERSMQEVIDIFSALHNTLLSHPAVIPLVGTAASYGMHAMDVLEKVLVRLSKAGMDGDVAARCVHTLMSYTIGSANLEAGARTQRPAEEKEKPKEWQRTSGMRFEMMPMAKYPTVLALAPHLAGFILEDRFITGLRQILDSYVDQIVPV